MLLLLKFLVTLMNTTFVLKLLHKLQIVHVEALHIIKSTVSNFASLHIALGTTLVSEVWTSKLKRSQRNAIFYFLSNCGQAFGIQKANVKYFLRVNLAIVSFAEIL